MPKAYSLHSIALKPGVTGQDFERFFHDEVEPAHTTNGMSVRLLRGEGGERKGRYLLMLEFECGDPGSPLAPAGAPLPGKMADQVAQWIAAGNSVLDKWTDFATPIDVLHTEYRECE
jgi:hypothetical protein